MQFLKNRPQWLMWGAAAIIAVIVFALQPYSVGFEQGTHGWTSAHGLSIFSHVSPESGFIGYSLAFVEPDGSLRYDYFDRYPLFYSLFMRSLFTLTDHIPSEIFLFRQVMNGIFLLTMAAGYRLVRLFIKRRRLALAVVLFASSSYYLLLYKDMIHFDQPALLGMTTVLWFIGRYRLGRGARWHIYAVTLLAVIFGRGYASFFVLGLWFLVEAVGVLFGGSDVPLTKRVGRVLRLDALWVTVIAVIWGAFWLGYNVTGEMRLRDVPVTETSIYNSARRRLPFFGNVVENNRTFSERGADAWGEFAVGQVQRVVLWTVPMRAAGDMHWSFRPGEGNVEVNGLRVGAFFVLLAVVLTYITQLRPPRRGTAVIAAFGGLIWTAFMINLTAQHIYVTMYSLGFSLMVYIALATWLGRRDWIINTLLALSVVVFVGGNWQMRHTRNTDPNANIDYTDDFTRIQQTIPTETGTVYPDYGTFRPWCIFGSQDQCYVLGYYMSDYRLTTYYPVADYVLAPRPYHVNPAFVDAGQTLDFVPTLNPTNTRTYLMDTSAAETRPAPADDTPLAAFGDRLSLHDWSLVGDVTLQPCESVRVEGWWQADPAPDRNLNLQIVMVDESGQAVTEANDPLGQVPTQLWEPGRFTLDARPLTVPCDTSPDEYPLIMGVYDPETLAPLPVTGADGNDLGNQMYLTTLFVE